ncbi:RNA methyltransferase [Bosea sp. Root381]|uniref:SAM-dependent methyltransferase n=1 Tax=Bosea sp. Root381 TaxID=1736524 RepID=UPI0006FA2E6A|nr:class I SAM-dependent methyltransferase [Bosea sp. Root381]KRE09850.1 RNA methyltransferase [Bosea sp. Root381]
MKILRTIASACAISALMLNGALAQSAPATSQYTPSSGQAGKDVVWVPTPQALVDRMLDMAKVTPSDNLVDLGSGDGRTVITAAKRGVRAHGIEYNPDLVKLAQEAAKNEGVSDRATFERADIFQSDFSKASVVTLFLLSALNLKLRPTLLDMPSGTRIVSNTFNMGDWEPDETISAGGNCTSYCTAFKWVVPAKVAGTWRLNDGELKLSQTYQMLSGTLLEGGKDLTISDAKMDGARITFTAGGKRFTGQVIDGKMTGQADSGAAWSATRTST